MQSCDCLEELKSGDPKQALRVITNNHKCHKVCKKDHACLVQWINGETGD